jgi:hypothetical protein
MAPMKWPMPAAGSRMRPPVKPRRCHRLPDGLDHVDLGVVAVVDGGARRFVVLGTEHRLQAAGASGPGEILGFEVEAGRQAAPAGVAQQDLTLLCAGWAVLGFDLPQPVDGRQIGFEFRYSAAQIIEVGTTQAGPDHTRCRCYAGDDAPACPGGDGRRGRFARPWIGRSNVLIG